MSKRVWVSKQVKGTRYGASVSPWTAGLFYVLGPRLFALGGLIFLGFAIWGLILASDSAANEKVFQAHPPINWRKVCEGDKCWREARNAVGAIMTCNKGGTAQTCVYTFPK